MVVSADALLCLYCFVFSGFATVFSTQIVPLDVEQSDVADHPTTLGMVELFAYMILIGMTVVFFVGFMMFLARDLLTALLM